MTYWRAQGLNNGKLERPLISIVANLTPSTEDKPSLLTYDEVQTIFHEFGHALHGILSNVTYRSLASPDVYWDFVELPSQIMENWLAEKETLQIFAKHYETGEPMPTELVQGMIAAKNQQSGMKVESQIYLGMIDQAYHTDEDGVVDTTQVGYDVYDATRLYKHTPETWHQGGFGHLTGYQAGYYGYMWSLVYAQDMFQRFNELGMLSPEAGAYYREKILSRGGTQDSLDMVRAKYEALRWSER